MPSKSAKHRKALREIAISNLKKDRNFFGPLRKFCVSVFRQNQEYHIINVHDWGLFPLATAFPGGWDGMRAGTA